MSERMLARMLAPLRRGMDAMISRAVVSAVQQRKIQALQVKLMADEVKGDVEHFEAYGLTAHPLGGAEALTVFPAGDRSHGIVAVVTDRRYRPAEMEAGEVCLFAHEDKASGGRFRLRLKNGRVMEILADVVAVEADTEVTVTAPVVTVVGTESIRLDAPDIALHAGHSWSWDVDGYGERVTSLGGGAYEIHTWQQGATVTTKTTPINPPEGP